MLRKTLSLTALLSAALAAPVSAADPPRDLIRIGRGMAGISLNMSQNEVKAVLGDPAKTRTGENEFGGYTELRFKGKLRVFFQGDENVTSISTTDDGQRTTKGIHVGSSETRLRQKHTSVDCEGSGGTRLCTIGRLEPGQRVTTFFINSERRVKRITVGFVID